MSSIKDFTSGYYFENEVRYVFMDGFACRNIKQCYLTLQKQLSLPDYFGHNLDALDEALSDLEWISQKKIRFIMYNLEELLANDPDKKEDFLDILNSSENERIEIIYLGVNDNS